MVLLNVPMHRGRLKFKQLSDLTSYVQWLHLLCALTIFSIEDPAKLPVLTWAFSTSDRLGWFGENGVGTFHGELLTLDLI